MESVQKQFALRKDFEFLPNLPFVGCLSSWAHNL